MADNQIRVTLVPNAFDLICLALVLVIILYTGISLWIDYTDLPDRIPTHYSYNGKVDAYGSPSSLIWLFTVQVGIAFMLFIVSRFPHKHNYMMEITEKNAVRIYSLSVSLLHGLNVIISMLFGYLVLNTLWVAQGITESLNVFVMIAFLVSIGALTAYFIWQMNKSK